MVINKNAKARVCVSGVSWQLYQPQQPAPAVTETPSLPEKQSTPDTVAPEKKPARNRARKPKAPAAEAKAANADEVPVA